MDGYKTQRSRPMNRKISPVGLMALDAVLQTQVAQGYLSEVQYNDIQEGFGDIPDQHTFTDNKEETE